MALSYTLSPMYCTAMFSPLVYNHHHPHSFLWFSQLGWRVLWVRRDPRCSDSFNIRPSSSCTSVPRQAHFEGRRLRALRDLPGWTLACMAMCRSNQKKPVSWDTPLPHKSSFYFYFFFWGLKVFIDPLLHSLWLPQNHRNFGPGTFACTGKMQERTALALCPNTRNNSQKMDFSLHVCLPTLNDGAQGTFTVAKGLILSFLPFFCHHLEHQH